MQGGFELSVASIHETTALTGKGELPARNTSGDPSNGLNAELNTVYRQWHPQMPQPMSMVPGYTSALGRSETSTMSLPLNVAPNHCVS